MNERRALGFGLSAVLLWSTVATAFKLTLAELTPIQMLTVASMVSAIALTAVCTIQGKLSSLASTCLLYTSPSPRDNPASRMPSSA